MQSQAQTLILILLMVVAFYFLIMRPQRKRQQAVQQTLRQLEPGSRVMLTSGIFATVVSVGDRQAVVELAPGVEMTILKQAIARATTDADEDAPADDLPEDPADAEDLSEPDVLAQPEAYRERSGLDLPPAAAAPEIDREQNRPTAN